MTNTPDPVDVHVGARIKLRRKTIGMPQAELATHLGLTFQQVQKYERGANRVSASKLYEIAKKLGTDIAYFFDGLPDPKTGEGAVIDNSVSTFLTSAHGVTVASLYSNLNDTHRNAVLQLLRSLSTKEDEVYGQNEEREEIDADAGYY